jgi:phosphoribosylformylglycinamidine synthase
VTLFSESASRAIVAARPERVEAFEALASARGVPWKRIGETGGPRMMFAPHLETTLGEARAVYEEAIPKLMAG